MEAIECEDEIELGSVLRKTENRTTYRYSTSMYTLVLHVCGAGGGGGGGGRHGCGGRRKHSCGTWLWHRVWEHGCGTRGGREHGSGARGEHGCSTRWEHGCGGREEHVVMQGGGGGMVVE